MLEHPPVATDKELWDIAPKVFFPEVISANANYPYWDKVKYLPLSKLASPRELWFALKQLRQLNRTVLHFGKYTFGFTLTDEMLALLHEFDLNIGRNLAGEHLIPTEKKNLYLISSIMEEAIASSRIEGATTTRRDAKEMLRKNDRPRNKGQQMILNNYLTIKLIKDFYATDFSLDKILEIHHSMTQNTMENEAEMGQLRTHNDILVMDAIKSEIAHTPPHFEELPTLLNDLAQFFNRNDESFIHPIVKGIILHFMLAYIHPFADGNGRTARSIFYWYMLKQGYWLMEYLSISRIIYQTKSAYEKAFLYTEYDDNDLTYFILYHLRTMKRAFEDLKLYLKREMDTVKSVQILSHIKGINERQAEILQIISENPNTYLTVKEIETRFAISNFTARTDLEGLVKLNYLSVIQVNKVKRLYCKSDNFPL